MAIWLTGQREEEKRGTEDWKSSKVTSLSVCLSEHSSITNADCVYSCTLFFSVYLCVFVCLFVCSKFCAPRAFQPVAPNEDCIQSNEMWSDNGGGNYSGVQQPLVKNYIIDQQKQHHGMQGKDAKMKRGENSTPKINSSSVWLPKLRNEVHRWVESVYAHTKTQTQTHSSWAASLNREHLQLCICNDCVVIQTALLRREICTLQFRLVKCLLYILRAWLKRETHYENI